MLDSCNEDARENLTDGNSCTARGAPEDERSNPLAPAIKGRAGSGAASSLSKSSKKPSRKTIAPIQLRHVSRGRRELWPVGSKATAFTHFACADSARLILHDFCIDGERDGGLCWDYRPGFAVIGHIEDLRGNVTR